MPAYDDATLYDILISHAQIDDQAVQPILTGLEHSPLDLLMRGLGPADMSISTDFSLWSEHLRSTDMLDLAVEVPLLVVYHDPTLKTLTTLRDAMVSASDRKRLLYWLAIHGDVESATTLYTMFHRCRDVRSPFSEGLHRHACKASRNKRFRWYPGLEIEILLSGVRSQIERFSKLAGVLNSIERWDETNRPAEASTSQSGEKGWLRDLVTIARTRAYERRIEAEQAEEDETASTKTTKRYADETDDEHTPVAAGSPERYSVNSAGLAVDWHLRKVVGEPRLPELPDQVGAEVGQVVEREAEKTFSLKAPRPSSPCLIVLRNVGSAKSARGAPSGSDDLMRSLEPIVGERLPLLSALDDLTLDIESLGDEFPHARDLIARLFSDIRPGEPVHLRPTLLVGAPGSGKTSLLKRLAGHYLAMPTTVFPCAAVADGSFGGTPSQWSTKRVSVPLELIRQSRTANPVVILDEIEKTGISSLNGSLVHALLPMLEKHTAKDYFEVGIERASDLSAVSFLATANDLTSIPPALRDRFRILEMPDPGPEHVADTARRIVNDLRDERGIDEAWMPYLEVDEVRVVQRTWKRGSLRRLRTAVEATVEAREAVLRARPM